MTMPCQRQTEAIWVCFWDWGEAWWTRFSLCRFQKLFGKSKCSVR